MSLNKFTPHVAKLLMDPSSSVRDTAFATLVDLYKHVGEKLRVDLQKRNMIPNTRLAALMSRFDEVKEAGELLPTASLGIECKCLPFASRFGGGKYRKFLFSVCR